MASPAATPEHLSPSNAETEALSSRSDSPDGNCPICLGKVNNKAFTDACFHTFCFVCLLEWSKIRATCPLCKTSFKSIIHNVVSNDIYDRYHLKPTDTGSFGTDSQGRRFRYSTTVTEEHRVELTWRRSQALERRHRRAHQVHLQAAAEERRRMIYRAGLWVRHLGSNSYTRFRDISPEFFRENPATTHRLVPWLRRDLGILFSSEDHVTFMTQYILSLIPNVHMQTEEFHGHIRPFLYGQTDHFIHELISFARSPYDMNTYDQVAQYDTTAPIQTQPVTSQPLTTLQSTSDYNEVISLSSDDEVIEVPTLRSLLRSDSTSSSVSQEAGGQAEALDLSATHNPEPPPGLPYDPDRPGPSGISTNQPVEIKAEQRPVQENVVSDDSDIEVIGFLKPYDERTPECVILLSSGTEEDEEKTESRQDDKEGGKRHQKRKHTQESDHMERCQQSSEQPSRSDEHSHGERAHRHSHKKKHKDKRHHKHNDPSSNADTHTQNENSKHRSRDQHVSQVEDYTLLKYHEKSRSRSRSKSRHSSHHTSKSGLESSIRTDEYFDNHSRGGSASSTHTHRSHSRSRSRQRTEKVYHKDSHRRHGDMDFSQESHQRRRLSEEGSWRLHWYDRGQDATQPGPAERFEYSVSSSRGSASTFTEHAHDHYEAKLSTKRKARDDNDDGERSQVRHSDDSHRSSLHLTMVFSRKKTKTPDRQERSSSSTDMVSVKSSHSHRKRHKKHKKHKSHRSGSHREKRTYSIMPYTLYSSLYRNEDEENDGDESSRSTEEESDTYM